MRPIAFTRYIQNGEFHAVENMEFIKTSETGVGEIYFSLSHIMGEAPFASAIYSKVKGEKPQLLSSSMPNWWQMPTEPLRVTEEFYHSEHMENMHRDPGIAFMIYTDDGRLQIQLRNYIKADGGPVKCPGTFAMNGGGMRDGACPVKNFLREAEEELGIKPESAYKHLGSIRGYGGDLEIYKITKGYESLLKESGADLEKIMSLLFQPEGLGRGFAGKKDLKILLSEGRLAPTTLVALTVFPELWPEA